MKRRRRLLRAQISRKVWAVVVRPPSLHYEHYERVPPLFVRVSILHSFVVKVKVIMNLVLNIAVIYLVWFIVYCRCAFFLLSASLTCPRSVMIKYLRSKGCFVNMHLFPRATPLYSQKLCEKGRNEKKSAAVHLGGVVEAVMTSR